MSICPCCSHLLLRHLSQKKVVWFCSQCRQNMPVFDRPKRSKINQKKVDLSIGMVKVLN